MVIFFFIFLVIFPDNDKMAKSARKEYDKLVAANAPAEKVSTTSGLPQWRRNALHTPQRALVATDTSTQPMKYHIA